MPALEIVDSEDEGSDLGSCSEHDRDQLVKPVTLHRQHLLEPPSMSPHLNAGRSDSSPSKITASGEVRMREIEMAQKALIGSSPPKPVDNDTAEAGNEKEKERDIYDFHDDSGDSDTVHLLPNVPKKVAKRAHTSPTIAIDIPSDSDSSFGATKKRSNKKTQQKKKAELKKKRSKTAPAKIDEEADYEDAPPSKRKRTQLMEDERAWRASTREKPRQNYYIPPPPGNDDPNSSERLPPPPALVAAAPTPNKSFMVDLTKEHLLLPTQKKMEYDNIPVNTNTDSPHSASGELQSTIPDTMAADTSAIPPLPSELTAKSFLQPVLGEQSPRRAYTDFGPGATLDSIHVASEWRAAKGKGRPNYSDAVAFEFNEDEVQSDSPPSVKKPRKPRAKKQPAKGKKSAAKEDASPPDPLPPAPAERKLESSPRSTPERELEPSAPLRIKLNVNTAPPPHPTSSIVSSESPSPGKIYKRTKSKFPDSQGPAVTRPIKQKSDAVVEEEHIEQPATADAPQAARKKARRPQERTSAIEGEPTAKAPTIATKKSRKKATIVKSNDEKPEPTPEDSGDDNKEVEPTPPPSSPPREKQKTPTPESTTATNKSHSGPTVPVPQPQTPKSSTKREAGLHSPIRKTGGIPHRVGLSRRSRVEPLLKSIKKT